MLLNPLPLSVKFSLSLPISLKRDATPMAILYKMHYYATLCAVFPTSHTTYIINKVGDCHNHILDKRPRDQVRKILFNSSEEMVQKK
jgi:hypothetical protein